MIQIIPALLATTEIEYQEETEKIKSSAAFEGGWVHIDFMDNKLVQNETVDIDIVNKYPLEMLSEAHLMVQRPSEWVEKLVNIGFDRLIAHAEIEDEEISRFLEVTKKFNKQPILAFNPETDLAKYHKFSAVLDGVLIMSVHPGFGGQKFIPSSIEKIKQARNLVGKDKLIGVDGGMDADSVKLVAGENIDYIVVGSHLLKGDIDANLEAIWEAVKSAE